MSKAQLVITAVVLEGRSKSEVARDYGISRYWVQQLVNAMKPRALRPFKPDHGDPTTTPTPLTQPLKTPSFDCAKP